MKSLSLLISILKKPDLVNGFRVEEWNLLIAQAYHCKLMGRLHAIFEKYGLTDQVPEQIFWHFHSAKKMARAHAQDIEIEVDKINQALKMGGLAPVYLKGAAYQLVDLEVADGRLYSDVDIFVNKENLPAAEHLLKMNGWKQGDTNEYDQQYYRRWMHEIPPLVHKSRGTTLDVHHNLLPLTSRIKLDSDKLSKNIDYSRSVLDKNDRILHSVVHLLMESEFDKGIRDLSDLDLLIRIHASENEQTWGKLTDRAIELGVGRLLFYALRYLRMVFGTPVPSEVTRKMKIYAPFSLLLLLMDWLFIKVLTEPPGLNKSISNRSAHFLMYLRGHWMRMPLNLLIPHLCIKSVSGLMFRKKTA